MRRERFVKRGLALADGPPGGDVLRLESIPVGKQRQEMVCGFIPGCKEFIMISELRLF